MTKPAAAYGFFRSLIILIGVLLVALVVFYPWSKTRGPAEPRPAEKPLAVEGASHRLPVRPQPAEDLETSAPGDAKSGTSVAVSPDTPGASKSPYDEQLQQAIKLIDGGKPEEASVILEAILKADPTNEQALVELAMVNLLDFRKADVAISLLERVLDSHPQNRIVMTELVSLYEEQGQPEAGLAFLNDLNAKHPESPDVAYGLGQMLSSQGRDSDAIPYLEKAAATTDQRDRVLSDLADAYSRTAQPERAIGAYREAISTQEKELQTKSEQGLPVAFVEEKLNMLKSDLAREYLSIGQLERAQEIINDLETRLPEDESVSTLIAQLKKARSG